MTGRPTQNPAVDVLRVLAVSRSSGALEIRGSRSGVFFLQDGHVSYAEALGIPLEQKFAVGDPRLPPSIENAIVDAGTVLLTGDFSDAERPLFRPGRRHWSGNTCLIDVEDLLTRMDQQISGFTVLGVEPDDEVRLCPLSAERTVILDREQWSLAAEISGPQTVRSLAWRLGLPLRTVITTAAALVAAGVMQRDPPAPALPAPSPGPPPAGPAPMPLSPEQTEATGLREMRLPHRVPGSTPMPDLRMGGRSRPPPTSTPGSAAARPPTPDDELADNRALALRLLEGLRRL